MYIITNRNLNEDESGFKQFGDQVNSKGPNELRLVNVEKRGSKWSVEIVKEDAVTLTAAERKRLGLSASHKALPSHRAALDTVDAMVKNSSHLLVYIHGFSNDMKTVAKRCEKLKENYGVEVFAFSWPTDSGGGALKRYKSDKRDARASIGAVERTFEKLTGLLRQLLDPKLDLKVSLMMHSMGCYLYENLMRIGDPSGHAFLFDNITMVAPDCNNHEHASWVDKIKVKGRVFVCINERDRALRFSEDLHGGEQRERLGQHLLDLNSKRAHYINFTDAPRVRSAHDYFEDGALKNKHVKNFFKSAFQGDFAENTIADFIPRLNYFRVQRFNENI